MLMLEATHLIKTLANELLQNILVLKIIFLYIYVNAHYLSFSV